MKITVKSFATLRDYMDAEIAMEIKEGTTIEVLLGILMKQYPGLREEIFSSSGLLKDYVNILQNGRNIAFLKDLDTILHDGDIIALFPPAGGG